MIQGMMPRMTGHHQKAQRGKEGPAPTAFTESMAMFMGHAYMSFSYSISYTLFPHDYTVTTNLHLIPSLFPPILLTPPHGNHQKFPVSMNLFLFCLFVFFFLDSIVSRCVFIAILLFIFLSSSC